MVAAKNPSALVVVSGEMAEMQSSLTEESTGDYNDGEVIYFAGQPVGTIIKRLGQGAMGTVYEFELSETRKRCALKSVRGDLDAKTRTELEKGLTSEVGVVFAAPDCEGDQISIFYFQSCCFNPC